MVSTPKPLRSLSSPDAQADETEDPAPDLLGYVSYTAIVVPQGDVRFYTLAMPTTVLARTCVVDDYRGNPLDGFQRVSDEKRARDIAAYINAGHTIPTAIVLSAQPEAEMRYTRKTRTLKFKVTPGSFLVLDGQHRVYGFNFCKPLRVPVVIYNNLSRQEEAKLFMDINTKQRPVPSELLLAIKHLAATETPPEKLRRDVFDFFEKEPGSPLLGRLAPGEKDEGKISRVTFGRALRAIQETFIGADPAEIYRILSAYLHAWLAGLTLKGEEQKIVNPTVFRAILDVFPLIAERVADRHDGKYTIENFNDVLAPFISRLRPSVLKKPGSSPVALAETFANTLRRGFSIGRA